MVTDRAIAVEEVAAFSQAYGSEFFLISTTGDKVEAAFQSLGERIAVFRWAKAEPADHARDLIRLDPFREVRLRHRFAVRRRVHDPRHDAVHPHVRRLQLS